MVDLHSPKCESGVHMWHVNVPKVRSGTADGHTASNAFPSMEHCYSFTDCFSGTDSESELKRCLSLARKAALITCPQSQLRVRQLGTFHPSVSVDFEWFDSGYMYVGDYLWLFTYLPFLWRTLQHWRLTRWKSLRTNELAILQGRWSDVSRLELDMSRAVMGFSVPHPEASILL